MGYIEKAKHCIGIGNKKPYTRHGKKFYRPYRNFYATGEYDEEWEMMILAGYAKRMCKNKHGGHTYYLTREGLDWLGDKLSVKIWNETS
ncbi:hypothetical protein DW241_05005 [Hungatella hathewayi]|nr:hypothetical protein DW241_05005 [Hungatella hathewayi]